MLIAAPFVLRLCGVAAGPGARLSPGALRSARRSGVEIGADSILHCRFSIDRPGARIRVGARCFIGRSHLVAAESITIEDDVIMSWGVTVVDHDSHALDWPGRARDVADWGRGHKDWRGIAIRPVTLRRRAWIGFNAIILKGVEIGEGAVVGAGSVVTRDVAPQTVVAGNPARPIRRIEPPHE